MLGANHALESITNGTKHRNPDEVDEAPPLGSLNSPIVCAVLALDSWNYCSGEQA